MCHIQLGIYFCVKNFLNEELQKALRKEKREKIFQKDRIKFLEIMAEDSGTKEYVVQVNVKNANIFLFNKLNKFFWLLNKNHE